MKPIRKLVATTCYHNGQGICPGGQYLYLQHNYERHFINEPTDFIANFIPISYCFHFHISISLGFFISYLEQSHSDFHTYPNAFIRIFHSPTLGISFSISYSLPGTFNGFFIPVAWGFHSQFHIHSLVLSMDFSFL
jgi:hypothetical protein